MANNDCVELACYFVCGVLVANAFVSQHVFRHADFNGRAFSSPVENKPTCPANKRSAVEADISMMPRSQSCDS